MLLLPRKYTYQQPTVARILEASASPLTLLESARLYHTGQARSSHIDPQALPVSPPSVVGSDTHLHLNPRMGGLVEEIYGPQIEEDEQPVHVYEYQNTPENRSWAGALPVKQGLYDPELEKDACGVGFAAYVHLSQLLWKGTGLTRRQPYQGSCEPQDHQRW